MAVKGRGLKTLSGLDSGGDQLLAGGAQLVAETEYCQWQRQADLAVQLVVHEYLLAPELQGGFVAVPPLQMMVSAPFAPPPARVYRNFPMIGRSR